MRGLSQVIVSGIITLSAQTVIACSIIGDYDILEIPEVSLPSVDLLPPPVVSVDSIRRGTGDEVICPPSDLGTIVLKVPKSQNGYRIEVVESSIDSDMFPSWIVKPLEEEIFNGQQLSFIWNDGGSYEQESIHVTLDISSVSPSGKWSQPTRIEINHPGIGRTQAVKLRAIHWTKKLTPAAAVAILAVSAMAYRRRRLRLKSHAA
jgi:hypothetical protein